MIGPKSNLDIPKILEDAIARHPWTGGLFEHHVWNVPIPSFCPRT
jgi:hypothetical protein